MKRALPEARWVELDRNGTVFNSFFEITNFDFGAVRPGRRTSGIFEDNDPKQAADGDRRPQPGPRRVLGVLGHRASMPVDLSNEAYKFGVNYFIYGLTH